jgi:drug/metabolite transporter (DMT)-like permease
LGAGFLLFTLGSRSVPAGEVTLYSLAETILAPIWVWLVINEVPSDWTLSGGVVVLSAVLLAALAGLRAARAARSDPPAYTKSR